MSPIQLDAPRVQPSAPRTGSAVRTGAALLVGRVLLVALASAAVWVVLVLGGMPIAFPPAPLLATIAMLPVNVACLLWVRRVVHADGRRLRELIGFSRRRLVRDILWGLLWIAVLYLPFVATIMGVMWLLHGDTLFEKFGTVFVAADSMPALPPVALAVVTVVAVLTFAPLNAPVEELVYRGAGQQLLARRLPVVAAIMLSAVAFGLQHAFYAPTPDGVLVLVCAFFVWGLGSGIIAHRQGRLMPLIIAHGLVNLTMTAPALAFL